MKYYLFLIILFSGCIRDADKRPCIVIGKQYRPIESGAGEHANPEMFRLLIKRVNGSVFFFSATEMYIDVDEKSYKKIKIGDKLMKSY